MVSIYDVTVNYEKEPLGIIPEKPKFGWKLLSDESGTKQKSFIASFTDEDGNVQSTGEIFSPVSDNVVFEKITFKPLTEYKLKLTVYTECGSTAEAFSRFVTAPVDFDEKAQWIKPEKPVPSWAMWFEKTFSCSKKIKKAYLLVSGLGYCEPYINGQKLNDYYLEMPIMNYEKEVPYRVIDITDNLESDNTFSLLTGDGFYSQNRVWNMLYKNYAAPKICYCENICMKAQIEIRYEDGSRETIVSDESFSARKSAITLNNVYGGETYDARLEDVMLPEKTVIDANAPTGKLVPCIMPPVRILRCIEPVKTILPYSHASDRVVYDFGENFAGVCRITLPKTPAGTEIVIRYAETTDRDGNIDMRSTGTFATNVIQQDRYITKGEDGETWNPRFTYHSFRFAEVSGFYKLVNDINVEFMKIEGIALGTDLKPAGEFICDNEKINALQKIALRTFLSNYHSYPEDCPAREKCGWTGDAQVCSDVMIANFDMASSYEKYVDNLLTTYEVYGIIPNITPGRRTADAAPLWGIVSVIIPYKMYINYGDRDVLEKAYPLMLVWLKNFEKHLETGLEKWGFGDWCPPVGNNSPKRVPVVITAHLAYIETLWYLIRIAKILGKDSDVRKFEEELKTVTNIFNEKFYSAENKSYGFVAADAAAYRLGVAPCGDEIILSAIDRIKADNFEMTTGIYGNKMLIPSLLEKGYGDIAYKYLFGDGNVNFTSMMNDGGTSLYECLEMTMYDMPKDKGVSSYNHPMHGGFLHFLYSHVAGIKPVSPAYRTFEIAPEGFSEAGDYRATYESPYGKIVSAKQNGKYYVEVPPSTVCKLILPVPFENSTESGGKYFAEILPGKYEF